MAAEATRYVPPRRAGQRAARGLAWIGRLSHYLSDPSVSLLLTLYIAAALCGDMDPSLQPQAGKVIERLRAQLADAPSERWRQGAGPAMLLCYGVERSLFAKALVPLQEYAEGAAQALSRLDSAEVAAAFIPAVLILQRLGMGPGAPPSSALGREPSLCMITADKDTIRSVVQDIERASHFGQRPVATAPGLVGGLTAVLEAHLIRALSDYHLEHGATLLRGLVYLDPGRTLATTTAARFLQDNQTEEGYFGFFDPEIRLMRSRANDPTAELGLLAPTLLAVLWALAEFERDDYRLYRDLGRGYREHVEEEIR